MEKKFFCENCGHAVPGDADVCPHCGSSFRAVKCPKCGFTGKPDLFAAGCPICGYLSENLTAKYSVRQTGFEPAQKPKSAPIPTEVSLPTEVYRKERKKALPDWFYPLAGLVLLGIIIALVVMYLKL